VSLVASLQNGVGQEEKALPITRILVVDDDPIIRLTLKTLLTQRGYEVVVAESGEEACAILHEEGAPKIAIVDWIMPRMDGVELCRILRKSPRAQHTYVIMLTGKREEQDLVNGLDNGADDYVKKPFDIEELLARVRSGQRLVTQNEELRCKANIDGLTGLFNRNAILDLLRRELAHAQREGTPVAVLLADADHFKDVNDTYGHVIGDAALKHVAKLLGARLRPYDAVGRYGGEEFLVVLPGCGLPYAMDVAERIRCSVACEPLSTSTGPVSVTISLGVAIGDADVSDLDELIAAADKSLYRAKHDGRNRIGGPETVCAKPDVHSVGYEPVPAAADVVSALARPLR
jgi:diguanylate cyclase (GGDEF)-like protein